MGVTGLVMNKILNYFENELPEYYKSNNIRQYQVQMAVDIAEFLEKRDEKIMIIEAPVGTGKSLGSLIPATYINNKKDQKVLYATSTVNLQSQLMDEEVPLLESLGLVKNAILAKGKAHYFCYKRFCKNINKIERQIDEVLLKLKVEDFMLESTTGQKEEFEKRVTLVNSRVWSYMNLVCTRSECTTCEHNNCCSSYQHRIDFNSTGNDLIITNHHQLIRSVLLKKEGSRGIIPLEMGTIIIDEGHDFQENFLSQYKKEFGLQELIDLVKHIDKKYKKRYVSIVKAIKYMIDMNLKEIESLQARYPLKSELIINLKHIHKIICLTIDMYVNDLMKISDYKILEAFKEKLDLLFDSRFISWICYENLTISSLNENYLFDFMKLIKTLAMNNKIIIMSGTLTSDGDFSYLIKQWGLNKDEIITKTYPTSFSYEEQALVYVPKNLYRHSSVRWGDYITNRCTNIRNVLNITKGRSLILTTSKVDMNGIYNYMKYYCRENRLELLKQDDSSIGDLTNKFKKDETSVLIGSGSFYSGFSVKGKSLISVILNKLPFPVPDDPYLKLVGRNIAGDMFKDVIFPHMMIKFNQAIGRLIRDINDYGVITVLDNRLFTQYYGNKIIESLEYKGYRVTRDYKEVEEFIKVKNENNELRYAEYDRNNINIPDGYKPKEKVKNKKCKKKMGKNSNQNTKCISKKKNLVNECAVGEQRYFYEYNCSINSVLIRKYEKAYSMFKHLCRIYKEKYGTCENLIERFPFTSYEQKKFFVNAYMNEIGKSDAV